MKGWRGAYSWYSKCPTCKVISECLPSSDSIKWKEYVVWECGHYRSVN